MAPPPCGSFSSTLEWKPISPYGVPMAPLCGVFLNVIMDIIFFSMALFMTWRSHGGPIWKFFSTLEWNPFSPMALFYDMALPMVLPWCPTMAPPCTSFSSHLSETIFPPWSSSHDIAPPMAPPCGSFPNVRNGNKFFLHDTPMVLSWYSHGAPMVLLHGFMWCTAMLVGLSWRSDTGVFVFFVVMAAAMQPCRFGSTRPFFFGCLPVVFFLYFKILK